MAGQTIDRPANRVQCGASLVKSVHMSGPARQSAPNSLQARMNLNHLLDLYGVYALQKGIIADTGRAERHFPPPGRPVFHKVIHRSRAPSAAEYHCRSRVARLAERDARALEWRVRRRVERLASLSRGALRQRALGRVAAHSPHFSPVWRIALMLVPRIAPGSFLPLRLPSFPLLDAPPLRRLLAHGAPLVRATRP